MTKYKIVLASLLIVFFAAAVKSADLPSDKDIVRKQLKQQETTAKRYGLSVREDCVLLKDGVPYRGIGVNYFDAFWRTLKDPNDFSYKKGFKILAEYQIPFARIMACGFWPKDNKLYFKNRARYFELFDDIVKTAEENNIGLILSLFWHYSTVPDIAGEPLDQWGNPDSKTHEFMRTYVKEVVNRYKDSPAIWGWEFGNEYNNRTDLPNASTHRAQVAIDYGTPGFRTKRDELSSEMITIAVTEFAKEVRKYDSYRMISTGNTRPRPSAYHQRQERTWAQDTPQQYVEILTCQNPDPIDVISSHFYWNYLERFGRKVEPDELIKITMRACSKIKKPFFIGEFGTMGKESPQLTKSRFYKLLDAIEKNNVQLAALWVYDYSRQPLLNVTTKNTKSYQLHAIADLNNRFRKQAMDASGAN